jgi:hypothetical protein
MAYQSQSNGYVAYKVQSALGTQAAASGGTVLRVAGGAGLQLTKAATESNEVRSDGMRQRGRHGTQKVTGEWQGEFSMGSHEEIMEAVVRGTWATGLTITASGSYGAITTASHSITTTSGDLRSLGLRVYDVVRLNNHATAANNNRNLRVTGLTSKVITVAETLTPNASGDSSNSITRPPKLIQPSTLVKRYFTVEEYDKDIDRSEIVKDFVFGSMTFRMQPNGLLMCDVGGVGTGYFSGASSGGSPFFSSPTLGTALPLSVVDATIRVKGEDVVDLTSLEITIDTQPMAPDTFGSGQIKYAQDVFTGQMAIGITFECLRPDIDFISDFAAETVYSLHILAVENESEPKDFLSIVIPNFTLSGVSKSALSKEGGPRTQSITVDAALVGLDATGTGYDQTMIKLQSTAA